MRSSTSVVDKCIFLPIVDLNNLLYNRSCVMTLSKNKLWESKTKITIFVLTLEMMDDTTFCI